MSGVARRAPAAKPPYSDASSDEEEERRRRPADAASEPEGQDAESDEYGSAEHSDSEASDRDSADMQDEDKKMDDANNQNKSQVVDHDEDRRNPQYIPKRGTFYEHDDRTALGGDEGAVDVGGDKVSDPDHAHSERGGGGGGPNNDSERSPAPPALSAAEHKRRPPKPHADKWLHDKYNENDQAPKSLDEIKAVYGYDIRGEEGPPKALRRHRYGRGPNKYTRNWEDENAYGKITPVPVRSPKAPPSVSNGKDFPALQSKNDRNRLDKRRKSDKNFRVIDTKVSPDKNANDKIIHDNKVFVNKTNRIDKDKQEKQVLDDSPRWKNRTPQKPELRKPGVVKPQAPPAEPVKPESPRVSSPPKPTQTLAAQIQSTPAAIVPMQENKLPSARKLMNPVAPRVQPAPPVAAPAPAQPSAPQVPVPTGDSATRGKRYSNLRQRSMPDTYQAHQAQQYLNEYQQQQQQQQQSLAKQSSNQPIPSVVGSLPHQQTPPPPLLQSPNQHHQPIQQLHQQTPPPAMHQPPSSQIHQKNAQLLQSTSQIIQQQQQQQQSSQIHQQQQQVAAAAAAAQLHQQQQQSVAAAAAAAQAAQIHQQNQQQQLHQQQTSQLLQQSPQLLQQQAAQMLQQQQQQTTQMHQQTPPPPALQQQQPQPPHLQTPPPTHQSIGRQQQQQAGLPMRQVSRSHQQQIQMHPMSIQQGGLVASQTYAAPPQLMAQNQYIQGANGAVYGHVVPQVYPPPQAYAAQPQHQSIPPQAIPPQALPPQALPPQAIPPQALPPQALPPQALPPHGYHHPTPAPPHQAPYPPHQPPRTVFREPGITYYSPQEQKGLAPPTRRPTNAIPIVPPPSKERGKSDSLPPTDNIDHIVDNMFVPREGRNSRPGETPPRSTESAPRHYEESTRQYDDKLVEERISKDPELAYQTSQSNEQMTYAQSPDLPPANDDRETPEQIEETSPDSYDKAAPEEYYQAYESQPPPEETFLPANPEEAASKAEEEVAEKLEHPTENGEPPIVVAIEEEVPVRPIEEPSLQEHVEESNSEPKAEEVVAPASPEPSQEPVIVAAEAAVAPPVHDAVEQPKEDKEDAVPAPAPASPAKDEPVKEEEPSEAAVEEESKDAEDPPFDVNSID